MRNKHRKQERNRLRALRMHWRVKRTPDLVWIELAPSRGDFEFAQLAELQRRWLAAFAIPPRFVAP